MRVRGSLETAMQRHWGLLAMLLIHVQGDPAFSQKTIKAVKKVIARCVKYNVPIFAFDQDMMRLKGSVAVSKNETGLYDWAKEALTLNGGQTFYQQWQGNVFADTSLEKDLMDKSIRDVVVVVGADGGECVRLTSVGCGAQESGDPNVQRGAMQRGFTVHTYLDALHVRQGANQKMSWLDLPGVICYSEL